MKYYSGVGSRETPPDIILFMKKLGRLLAERGYILRSGGADGADWAFQDGWFAAEGEMAATAEIYIPWNNFNGLTHGQWDAVIAPGKGDRKLQQKAEEIASQVHPAWERLSQGAQKLHSRNIFQVLGKDLDTPSSFLVCWANTDKDGVPKGGTRTAWVVAEQHGISCYNLKNPEHYEKIKIWVESAEKD